MPESNPRPGLGGDGTLVVLLRQFGRVRNRLNRGNFFKISQAVVDPHVFLTEYWLLHC